MFILGQLYCSLCVLCKLAIIRKSATAAEFPSFWVQKQEQVFLCRVVQAQVGLGLRRLSAITCHGALMVSAQGMQRSLTVRWPVDGQGPVPGVGRMGGGREWSVVFGGMQAATVLYSSCTVQYCTAGVLYVLYCTAGDLYILYCTAGVLFCTALYCRWTALHKEQAQATDSGARSLRVRKPRYLPVGTVTQGAVIRGT